MEEYKEEEVDKVCMMTRSGLSGRMFFPVPAHKDKGAVKRLCVCIYAPPYCRWHSAMLRSVHPSVYLFHGHI